MYDSFLFLRNHFLNISHFIHSLVDEHLDYFHFLVILNNAVMNIHMQGFVWIYVLISFDYMPEDAKNEITGSSGNSMFIILRNS